MTLTVELPEEIANVLRLLPEKDLNFYRAGIQHHATVEAQKLARMTPEERKEYEDVCAAISESVTQFERGKYMTLDEAKERSQQEIASETLRSAPTG